MPNGQPPLLVLKRLHISESYGRALAGLGRLDGGGLSGQVSETWSSEWPVLHQDSLVLAWPVKQWAKRLESMQAQSDV